MPPVVVSHFGSGDVKLVGDAGQERLYVVALVFEGIILGEIEADSSSTNNHGERAGRNKRPNAECLSSMGEKCVSHGLFTLRISLRHRADSNR